MAETKVIQREHIRPNPGPQTEFLTTPASIAIYGGAAGGGKSWALLMEALRHVARADYRADILRRTYSEIESSGGLWDASHKIYGGLAKATRHPNCKWTFPSGATIRFNHCQYESDKYKYQGAQIDLLGFDELTHFSESQFWYIWSRTRSVHGVRAYLRATCNPDPQSFVRKIISWYLDENGYAIPARSGNVRWFLRSSETDELVWADSKEELTRLHSTGTPRSLTFIPAKLGDNPYLDDDGDYRGNLESQPKVDRARLLDGCWNIVEGNIIDTANVKVYPANLTIPNLQRFCTIDTAGTSRELAAQKRGKKPSWSVCAVWDYDAPHDNLYLRHVWRGQVGWLELKTSIAQTIQSWHVNQVWIENAHHGPALAAEVRQELHARVQLIPTKLPRQADSHRGAKLERAIASGLLVRIENGRMLLPEDRSPWVVSYVGELAAWDGHPESTADQIDVSSGACYVANKGLQVWGGLVTSEC